jgi:hypothetical protein
LTAFVSVFLVIEIAFFVGLTAGRHIMEHLPNWRKQSSRLSGLLERYQTIIAFLMLLSPASGSKCRKAEFFRHF